MEPVVTTFPIPFVAVPQRDTTTTTGMSDTIEVSRDEFEQLVNRLDVLEQENAEQVERLQNLVERQNKIIEQKNERIERLEKLLQAERSIQGGSFDE